ncbi:hypothetical protein [Seohaeicola zhoushanensis]|uniref:Uncharacterized protein n=1 Tax=Seohaeicola zhoushanensis TaxID=1569283 RepID=A0A8J3GVX2_9RHOB|nr:hypothetical protein [Seohaeicola zhoushanensis]GHF42541.1 hypothetical protein GCM10017056_12880 [Seohaeicola zhoushanensis]
MRKLIKRFLRGESGAVTVDWVVLTAAVVALAGVAFSSIQTASGGVGTGVGNYLTNKTVGE